MTMVTDGLFQYGGEPVGSVRFTNPWASVIFVDGDDGATRFEGNKPNRAKLTFAQGITAASYNDIIYVRPRKPGGSTAGDASDVGWYAEVGTTIPFAKHALSIIGVLHGGSSMYGAMLWPSDGCGFDVYASAFHAENLNVHAESVTYAVRLRGTAGYATQAGACGSTLTNCTFGYGSVLVTGGGDTRISGCQFRNATLNYDASATPARRHRVENCWFGANNGAARTGPYFSIAGSQSEFLMKGCYFDQPTSTDEYISSTGVNDGLIADCYFADNDMSWGSTAEDEIRVASGTLAVVGCYDDTGTMITNTG